MNVYREVEVFPPVILKLSTIGVYGQLRDLAALPSEEELLGPFKEEAGWSPDSFWTLWSRRKVTRQWNGTKQSDISHKPSSTTTLVFMRKFFLSRLHQNCLHLRVVL